MLRGSLFLRLEVERGTLMAVDAKQGQLMAAEAKQDTLMAVRWWRQRASGVH